MAWLLVTRTVARTSETIISHELHLSLIESATILVQDTKQEH